jgi:hypothetical protein
VGGFREDENDLRNMRGREGGFREQREDSGNIQAT